MEYPESEELQEVYESLSQANTENDLLRRELEGARAEVARLRSINTDLLAACQDALAVFDRYIHSATEDAAGIERIRAAIAKAVQP